MIQNFTGQAQKTLFAVAMMLSGAAAKRLFGFGAVPQSPGKWWSS
jgi:hypothetical protein